MKIAVPNSKFKFFKDLWILLDIKSIENIIAFILRNNECITYQLSQWILSRNIIKRVSYIQKFNGLVSQHLTGQRIETNQVSK